MQVTRRDLAVASVLALGGSNLSQNTAALADAPDDSAVRQAVEALRKAVLDKDKARLEELTAAQLSYVHSDGRVQTKAECIDGVMSRKALMKSLTFPDPSVGLAGNAAVARHIYASESETDGKPNSVKIGVLAVWKKQDGNWKPPSREGYRLA